MCIRHVYECNVCQRSFPLPLGPPPFLSSVFKPWQDWLLSIQRRMVGTLGGSPSQPFQRRSRDSVTDVLCKNQWCQRRSEAGYQSCLTMSDPCWFCLRFGHQDLCYNLLLKTYCLDCVNSGAATPSSPLKNFFRRQQQLQRDYLYTDAYCDRDSQNAQLNSEVFVNQAVKIILRDRLAALHK